MTDFERSHWEDTPKWDESVIPPEKREYLRKLLLDPKETERFWSDSELAKKLESPQFLEMMNAGFLALELEYPFLQEIEGNEEHNREYQKLEEETRLLFRSYHGQGTPLMHPEIFRKYFTLIRQFMIGRGVPEKRLEPAIFLACAYDLGADYYVSIGIDPTKTYPFEEPLSAIKERSMMEKEASGEPQWRLIKKQIKRGPAVEMLPEEELDKAELGEAYLEKHAGKEVRQALLKMIRQREGNTEASRLAQDAFEKWIREQKEKS